MPSLALAEFVTDSVLKGHLSAGNWKQALKTVEKKLKKSPNDTNLLTVQAAVFCNTLELSESYKLCIHLLTRIPPLSHPDEITLIHTTIFNLEEQGLVFNTRDVEKLWENAIKAQETLEQQADLTREWLKRSIYCGHWHLAQKALLLMFHSTRDSDPVKRKLYFGQIVAFYLSSRNSSLNSTTTTTHGRLAFMMLEKAAQEPTQSSVTTAKPPIRIVNSEELSLLCHVYKGAEQDMVRILRQENMNKIARNNPVFIRAEVDGQKVTSNWEETWAVVKRTLMQAQKANVKWQKDDHQLWRDLVDAEFLLKDVDKTGTTRRLIEDSLQMSGHARNTSRASRKALLRFIDSKAVQLLVQASSNPGEPVFEMTERLRACQQQFELYSDQNSCIDDLEEHFSKLDPAEIMRFRKFIVEHTLRYESTVNPPGTAQLGWLISEINTLRFDFILIEAESSLEIRDGFSRLVIIDLDVFVYTCLRLYHISGFHTAKLPLTDTDPGDEACILAVLALEKLYLLENDRQSHLIRAVCLLEFLLSHSPFNSKARLMLVNLYRQLGLYSLAFNVSKGMKVKGILFESVSPVLLTRIASLHPSGHGEVEPCKQITKTLEFYKDALLQIPHYQEMALQEGNYSQIISFNDLTAKLRNSLTRRMLIFERRRIARLLRLPYQEEYNAPSKKLSGESLRSNEKPLFRTSIKDIPAVSKSYINWLEYTDVIFDLASPHPQRRSHEEIQYWHHAFELGAWIYMEPGSSGMNTEAEMSSALLAKKLSWLSFTLGGHLNPSELTACTLLEHLQSFSAFIQNWWLPQDEDDITPVPAWQNHHAAFLALESSQAVHNIATKALLAIKEGKLGKPSTSSAEQSRKCTAAAKALQASAVKWVGEIRARVLAWKQTVLRYQARMVDDVMGRVADRDDISVAMYDLMGEAEVESVLRRIGESAVEALDGVLLFRLV